MAQKSMVPSVKRKVQPTEKFSNDARAKKAKTVAGPKHTKPANDTDLESDSVDSSDSDDGGAEINSGRGLAAKANTDTNGSTDGAAKGLDKGQTSREAHAKQKQLAQDRKAAKPLADEVHRTKKLWERLRRKSHVPKEERQQLVDELFSIITGRIKDFVLKHDAVRAVQTAIKYSTPAQRKQIAKELQGAYAQLAESRYAKFLIGKLLVQNDTEIRDIIIPEFYGKVRKLINHSEASWILDDIYRGAATVEQKAHMLREWYGPEFALFRSENAGDATADLSKILANEPSKRSMVMRYLFDMTNNLIQKKMTGFTMLHDAMLQYFLSLKPETDELKEFVEIVKGDENGDLLKNMAFTKSGARLVCLLLAHGSAKDRKQILKTYKDTFQLMCGDPNAHMIIVTAYDVIDDTVLTAKSILPEILGKNDEKELENIVFLANDPNARITVLYLLEGQSRSLFPSSHAYDLELLSEIHEIRKTSSKKEAEIRRKELVTAMSPQLLAALAASPKELVATSFGCQFVTDVLLSATGDKVAALEAIASTAAGEPNPVLPEDADPLYPPPPHISLTPHGGKMYKTLIAGGRFDKATGAVKRVEPPLNFADILYLVIKDQIIQWAVGPSSFTVLGLLEAPDFSFNKELLKLLKSDKKALQQAVKGDETNSAVNVNDAKPEPKSKGVRPKAKSGGNQGARLLLEKL